MGFEYKKGITEDIHTTCPPTHVPASVTLIYNQVTNINKPHSEKKETTKNNPQTTLFVLYTSNTTIHDLINFMPTFDKSSSLMNITSSNPKSIPSSPTSVHHRSAPTQHPPQLKQHEEYAQQHLIHQSYSSTTSLEKQSEQASNFHALHMSPPSYMNPHHHQGSDAIATSTISSTNTLNNNSIPSNSLATVESSALDFIRSNHRNSPPSFNVVRQATPSYLSPQENESSPIFNTPTTKTSNNVQHFSHSSAPSSFSAMNGNAVSGNNHNNLVTPSTVQHHHHQQHEEKVYQSNQTSANGTNSSGGNITMNGSSTQQHSQTSSVAAASLYGMNGSNVNNYDVVMGQRSSGNASTPHEKNNLLPSLHILMDSPASTSSSNPIPHSNSRVFAPPVSNPNHHMRQSSTNNIQQSNYMNQPPITPIPYSHVSSSDYAQPNHVPYINKASHHIDMFSNSTSPNNPSSSSNMKPSASTMVDATNMYAPRPIRSRSNTSSGGNTSFNGPTHPTPPNSSQHYNTQNETVYSFEQPAKIKKKKHVGNTAADDSNDNDKKNWKKKRLFSIDEVTDLVAFVKQRSDNQELTRDVNYAIFKEYEKLQDERRRASVYRKKYVQLFERHLISKDGTIDPSLFQEYDQRASTSKGSKGSHSEDVQEKRKYSDVEEDSSSEGSNVEEEKKTKKVKREYSDEEDEDNDNAPPSEEKKKNMKICVSYKGKNYLHSIEKNILQNSDSIHNYFTHLTISTLCCNNDTELIRNESVEYFDYSFGEFIQVNSFSITRVLKSTPVKLRIN